MNRHIKSTISIASIVSVALPLLFFFKQYAYGFGNIYLTGAVMLSILCFVHSKKYVIKLNKKNKALLYFSAFYIFRLALTAITGESVANRAYFMMLLQYLASALVIIILTDYVEPERFYKVWMYLCIIVGIAVIIQSFQIYILRKRVSIITLLKPVVSSVMTDVWHRTVDRPVAFFTEPACIASFSLPVLFVSLKKEKIGLSVFLSIILLLCASTSAIVEIGLIWLLWIIKKDLRKSAKIGLIIVFVIITVLVFVLPFFNTTIDKLLHEISGESIGFRSRVTNGWIMFNSLETKAKIIGANNIDLTAYIRSKGDLLIHASQTRTENGFGYFFNTAQRIGLTSGIIGIIAYALMLITLYKNLNKSIRPYFWVVVIEMFYAWNFYTSNYWMIQMFTLFVFGKYEFESFLTESNRLQKK